MIISFRHNILFVRGHKVGGTSVEMALSTVCGDDDIVPPMIPVDERARQLLGGFSGNYGSAPLAEAAYGRLCAAADAPTLPGLRPPSSLYSAHMSVAEAAATSGIDLARFRVVAIVRNPYSRIISAQHMRGNFAAYLQGRPMPDRLGDIEGAFDVAIKRGGLSYLRLMPIYGNRIDVLLRYETLADDLEDFGLTLGVQLPPLPHAKRGAMASGIDPTRILRRDQIDIINEMFDAEFEAFGYDRL